MITQILIDVESGRLELLRDFGAYIMASSVIRRFSLFEAYATKPAYTLNHNN